MDVTIALAIGLVRAAGLGVAGQFQGQDGKGSAENVHRFGRAIDGPDRYIPAQAAGQRRQPFRIVEEHETRRFPAPLHPRLERYLGADTRRVAHGESKRRRLACGRGHSRMSIMAARRMFRR